MTTRHAKHVALIICCASIGCDSPTKPVTGCLGDVPVEISSSGSAPRFEWSPPCGISTLIVETVPAPGASAVQVWLLTADEQRPIGPSITYGATPRGATAPHPAIPLVHDVTYRVSVVRVVGGDAIGASGMKIFTY